MGFECGADNTVEFAKIIKHMLVDAVTEYVEEAVCAVEGAAGSVESVFCEAHGEDAITGAKTRDEVFGVAVAAFIDITLGAAREIHADGDGVDRLLFVESGAACDGYCGSHAANGAFEVVAALAVGDAQWRPQNPAAESYGVTDA